jgi:hypothetical protein
MGMVFQRIARRMGLLAADVVHGRRARLQCAHSRGEQMHRALKLPGVV